MDRTRGYELVILLVEDNPADVRLLQEAFRNCRSRHKLHVASDGEEALDFLHQKKKFLDAPRPDLILLDLNLPKKDGREVLETIKSEPALSEIPVLVLSTSRAPNDLHESYRLHANSYLTKPTDLDEFLSMAESIEEFWFHHAQLPTRLP